jgi:hypothetical protein
MTQRISAPHNQALLASRALAVHVLPVVQPLELLLVCETAARRHHLPRRPNRRPVFPPGKQFYSYYFSLLLLRRT